ncbi:K(+)-transporting ATPase subunit F [Gordonia humi]|uniref:K+-transporting ATPase KdpF subunit n=1 Tax=Gordonia humi TaxID=686429 RepID=A0A840EPR7_9ACTN|nr:K(+)-transporting ATPase subunit F [Gordonia humi]MBB4133682.1 K+-transporting ATPase KdpF subunit [Gordonia humi]
MSGGTVNVILAVVALAVLGYLFVALLFPERF